MKSNHRVLWKNVVNTMRVQVFTPDNSATVLAAAKMFINSNEYYTYVRFLILVAKINEC
jgi:hypothetical protein